MRACGATVARLTPDQKVACSNHVGLIFLQSLRVCFWSPACSFEILIPCLREMEKKRASLGGLEPPTFRLTAERANRLRHRDLDGDLISQPPSYFSLPYLISYSSFQVLMQWVAWPSGLRRWFKAPVSSEAWVRIPPLPDLFFVLFSIFKKKYDLVMKQKWAHVATYFTSLVEKRREQGKHLMSIGAVAKW